VGTPVMSATQRPKPPCLPRVQKATLHTGQLADVSRLLYVPFSQGERNAIQRGSICETTMEKRRAVATAFTKLRMADHLKINKIPIQDKYSRFFCVHISSQNQHGVVQFSSSFFAVVIVSFFNINSSAIKHADGQDRNKFFLVSRKFDESKSHFHRGTHSK
jgi:hypothetical protein